MSSVAGAFKEHSGDMFLPASIGAEIMQDFIRCLTWQWINDEVQRLSEFYTQYEHCLVSGT